MTDRTQPDSDSTHIIRYALEMGLLWIDGDGRDKVREALDALDILEAELEAVGAGGVEPLRKCLHQIAEPALSAAAAGFDEHGFRDWVLRNMPDDTIIGNSAWWADHLTSWAKRFVNAAPQPSTTPQADSQPAPVRDYPPLPRPDACDGASGTIGWSEAAMRAYVDADRAARAPADSVLEDAARLEEAVGLLEELAEHDNYSTEYDGRMLSICPECGEQDGEHRPKCAFVRAKTFLAARKQGGAT